MLKRIGALAVVLLLLVITERLVYQRLALGQWRAGVVVTLVPGDVQPHMVDVRARGRRWRYVLDGGAWRFPAYHHAFVEPQAMTALLRSVTGCSGTWVGVGADSSRFGLTPGNLVEVVLRDVQGRRLQALQVGAPVPATGGREAYVRVGERTGVYHGHSNPRQVLGHPVRALVDARVFPAGLGLGRVVEISFWGWPRAQGWRLRQFRLTGGRPLPGAPQYGWELLRPTRTDTCVEESVVAYLRFLRQLRFQALEPAKTFVALHPRRGLVLQDDTGRTDTLEVGAATDTGEVRVKLRTTGQVARITAAAAALLLPQVPALLDTLAQPSPYARAALHPPQEGTHD